MKSIKNVEIIVSIEVNQIVSEDKKLILAKRREEQCRELSRENACTAVGLSVNECCNDVLATLSSPLMVDNFESVLRASRSLDAGFPQGLSPEDIKDGE